MTPYVAIPRGGRLPIRPSDPKRVIRLLRAIAGPSGRCETDVGEVARLLGLRPLSVMIALLSLSAERRIDLLYAPESSGRFAVTIAREGVLR